MTTLTPEATIPSPFSTDPFYALGIADAYDEQTAGEDIHTLKRRADEMLDTASASIASDLYVIGYATAVIGMLNSHIAQINAQAEVAHWWLNRKGQAA